MAEATAVANIPYEEMEKGTEPHLLKAVTSLGIADAQKAGGAQRNFLSPAAKALKGPEKAAIILLALGKDYGRGIWSELDDDDVRIASFSMANLGSIDKGIVEEVLMEFVYRLSAVGMVTGSLTTTERLLKQFLPDERVVMIMEELRGPTGLTMWEKISNIQEEVLANYLKNEYPQTIAVVLSKLRPDHTARVLALFQHDLAIDVVQRMLTMETVQKDILERVEQTLRSEFMTNLYKSRRRDPYEMLAEVFNNFDRQAELRFISQLEAADPEAAERIKSLMFTFEDLAKLDNASLQTVLRATDIDMLPIALKGASDSVREVFFANLSRRALQQVKEDIEVMGPKRMKDIEEAQSNLVILAKSLAESGDIIIAKTAGADEIVE